MKNSLPSLATACFLAGASLSPAATIAFSNDFSAGGLDNTSLFTQPGGGLLRYSVTTNNSANPAVAYSSSQITNAADTSFSLSTVFRATSLGANGGANQSVGIGLFGVDATFAGAATTPYLTASYSLTNGTLSITEVDGTNTVISTAPVVDLNGATGGTFTAGSTFYTLRVDVTSLGSGTYNFSLGVFDATGTTQFGSSSTVANYNIASPTTTTDLNDNGFYGIRARLPQTSGTTTVEFDSFAAVPEPTTSGLLLGGMLAGLFIRRRARA